MTHEMNVNIRPRSVLRSFMPLALLLSAGLYAGSGFSGIHAQATSGAIYGSAPAGQIVTIQSSSGMTRHVKVNGGGHYRLGSLPVGVYSAVLEEGGQEVDMRSSIRLTVGGSAKVDFGCSGNSCAPASGSKGP